MGATRDCRRPRGSNNGEGYQVPEIVELSSADLDAVAGGANAIAGAGGLVNAALSVDNIDLLRNANINVLNGVTIKDIANNNNLSVGAVIQLMGGGAAVITRQTP